ncbi:WAS/WASL-interacting protein family member 3 isoform X8 [Alligator sinensis]|nr:WAS/WASL-interacting protein family member 3 isoform X8 [Alligator sinensis]
MNNNIKTCSNFSNPPDGAKAASPWEPASAPRAGPTRPSLPTPPLPPPPSSKPSLTFPSPPSHPPPTDRPAKWTPQNVVSPPPPQCDKPAKFQASAFHPPPPPPPLPLTPPYGLPVRNDLSSSSPSPQPEIRDYLHPTPPPPPPPLLPTYTSSSTKPSLPLLPSPAPSRDINSSDVPPPLPPKSPYLLSQFQKPNIQSMPLPPTPPFPQPPAAVQKRRPGRVAVSGAGKLPLPPQPPARSPTTELTSKSPYAQAGPWPAREPSPQLRNGNMPVVDDFESKFTFHSVEDFPPPDEFKPFQRIYPSKEPRGCKLTISFDPGSKQEWQSRCLSKLPCCSFASRWPAKAHNLAVLYLGRNNPQHTYKLGNATLASTTTERDLRVMTDHRINVSC